MAIRGLAALLLVLVTLASVSDVSSLTAKFEVRVYVDKYAYDQWDDTHISGVTKDDQITDFVKSLFYWVTAIFADIDKGIEMRLADVVIDTTHERPKHPCKTYKPQEVQKKFIEMMKTKSLSTVDHSILLTGMRMRSTRGELGGRMCDEYNSHSIVYFDRNVTTAMDMAHELGRSLGAVRQTDCCENKMAPGIMQDIDQEASPASFRFSTCSKTSITTEIEELYESNHECVTENAYPDAEQGKSLGDLYGGADGICTAMYGEGFLFGRIPRNAQNHTHERKKIPLADGYACGTGKVCELGRCVPSDRSDLADVSDECPLGDMPPPFKWNGTLCSEKTQETCHGLDQHFCCETCRQN